MPSAEDIAPSLVVPGRRPSGFILGRFEAMTNPYFRLLFIGNLLQFGSMQMQQVVRGYLVFHITGSFAALGTMALANAIPSLIGSPIGGVVADRATKRRSSRWGRRTTSSMRRYWWCWLPAGSVCT